MDVMDMSVLEGACKQAKPMYVFYFVGPHSPCFAAWLLRQPGVTNW
jgi:hypothetical protein